MTEPLDDSEPKIPAALQRDLRQTFSAQVRIPASVDAALAAAARRTRIRPLHTRPSLWLAAALLLAMPLLLLPRATPQNEPLAREDFDHNGRVDVLDAFRLSLAVQHGETVPLTFDLDGNGQIDARDIDLIAIRAVAIHG